VAILRLKREEAVVATMGKEAATGVDYWIVKKDELEDSFMNEEYIEGNFRFELSLDNGETWELQEPTVSNDVLYILENFYIEVVTIGYKKVFRFFYPEDKADDFENVSVFLHYSRKNSDKKVSLQLDINSDSKFFYGTLIDDASEDEEAWLNLLKEGEEQTLFISDFLSRNSIYNKGVYGGNRYP